MTDKAIEYQQAAALFAMDAQIWAMLVRKFAKENNTDLLMSLADDIEERRERIINDKEYREMRYNASAMVHSIPQDDD